MLGDHARANLLGRIGIAHAAGLWVAGMIATIQSDTGFDVPGAAFAGALGGLFSIPWIAALVLLVSFRPAWIGQHPILFAIVGPILVSGSWALSAGQAFLDAVAISSVTSSLVWMAMAIAAPVWRARAVARSGTRSVR